MAVGTVHGLTATADGMTPGILMDGAVTMITPTMVITEADISEADIGAMVVVPGMVTGETVSTEDRTMPVVLAADQMPLITEETAQFAPDQLPVAHTEVQVQAIPG